MKRFASEISLTALSQIVAMLSVIGIQIILARSVSVEVFGQLAVAQALVALVEAALVARGAEAAIQVLGQHWDDGDATLKAIARHLTRYEVLVSGLSYLAFAGLALAFAPAVGADGLIVAALGLAVVVQINYGLRRSLFLLNHLVREQALFEIAYSLFLILLAVPMIWFFKAWGLVITLVSAAAFKNISVHIWTMSLWSGPARAPIVPLDGSVRRTIRISSFHSVLRNLLSNGATNADILILGMWGRPEVVAIYRVAKTFATLPTKVAGPLWAVLRPRLLTALRTDDHRRFCLLISGGAGVFAIASVLGLVLVMIVGGPLLVRFYGATYLSALTPLIALIIGSSVFGAITGWLSFTLVISSRKSLGTVIFAAQLALIIVGGTIIGGGSATAMAWVVASCNIIISAVAWWALLAGRFRHRPPPKSLETDEAPLTLT